MNLYGILAIYKFEMARMWRTLMQSVASPVISTSLYFVSYKIGSFIDGIAKPTSSLDHADPADAEHPMPALASICPGSPLRRACPVGDRLWVLPPNPILGLVILATAAVCGLCCMRSVPDTDGAPSFGFISVMMALAEYPDIVTPGFLCSTHRYAAGIWQTIT